LLLAVAIPLFIAAWRGSVDVRSRLSRWAIFLGIVAATLLICQGIAMGVRHPLPEPVWVPRYLGGLWAPVCISLMVLLDRLPPRGLRLVGIVGLVGLNLFCFAMRTWGDTEPPVDLMVRDIVADSDHPHQVHTFLQVELHGWGPGQGSIYNYVGEYYI